MADMIEWSRRGKTKQNCIEKKGDERVEEIDEKRNESK